MPATDPTSPDFLFLALIGTVILIILLQSYSILKQQTTTKEIEDNQSKISSLSNLIETITDNQELWAETVEQTQENLVRMFMELEEAKRLAGLLPPVEADQPSLLEGAKEQFTELLEQRSN